MQLLSFTLVQWRVNNQEAGVALNKEKSTEIMYQRFQSVFTAMLKQFNRAKHSGQIMGIFN